MGRHRLGEAAADSLGSLATPTALADAIQRSPAMVAQRQQLARLFGPSWPRGLESENTAQRQAESDKPAGASALIVEDGQALAGPRQMGKGAFLKALQAAIHATAQEVLEGTGATPEDCPYIRFWFTYYQDKDAAHIERAIQKYVSGLAAAKSAQDYIDAVCLRVKKGFEKAVATGAATELPEGVPSDLEDERPEPGANARAIQRKALQTTVAPLLRRAAAAVIQMCPCFDDSATEQQRPLLQSEGSTGSGSTKAPEFFMGERDYETLRKAAESQGVGGICTAISVNWLNKKYHGRPLPRTFAEEDLEELAREQKKYYGIAMSMSGDKGFIAYSASEGLQAKQVGSDSVHSSGEIDELENMALENHTGYVLSFSETNIGSQSGHVIALFREGSNIQVRDQNVGQMNVSDMGTLKARYEKMMEQVWKEYYEQRDLVRTGKQSHITVPGYRNWQLFSMTPLK